MTPEKWIGQGAYFDRSNGQRIFCRRAGKGPPLVLLHGFPSWSYDFAKLSKSLENDFDVIAFDFLGYGASDKPRKALYSVFESADLTEELLRALGVKRASFLVHDYGAIVGQELVDRFNRGRLSFQIDRLSILNCGIIFSAYKPRPMQRLLSVPLIGKLIANGISESTMTSGIRSVIGNRYVSQSDIDALWFGMSRQNGHKLSPKLLNYNRERKHHGHRWFDALITFRPPLQLIWGMLDPVSGADVLAAAHPYLPDAEIVPLPDVGHFPHLEAPNDVSDALRSFLLRKDAAHHAAS